MAVKKPLVLGTTGPENLQSGDSIEVTISGVNVMEVTSSVGIAKCTPLYVSATGFEVDLARGNALTTSKIIGLANELIGATGAVATSGLMTATVGEWDDACDESIPGGLTLNQYYWLSTGTAGKFTSVVPSGAGNYYVLIGRAASTQSMTLFYPFLPIKL